MKVVVDVASGGNDDDDDDDDNDNDGNGDDVRDSQKTNSLTSFSTNTVSIPYNA